MVETSPSTFLPPPFPDHTQLPESDGTFVKNFQEHPQSLILTDSIGSTLEKLHPDGQYCIGQDCGIYWREADPPEQGAEEPIPEMGIELGVWRGIYQNQTMNWLRWWDATGNLLLIGDERAAQADERAAQAQNQLQMEQHKRQQLVQKLLSLSPAQLQALGIDLNSLN